MFILILAIADFWAGVILAILSAIGVISMPIWQILIICGAILAFCIVGLHCASVVEYSDEKPDDYQMTADERAERALRKKFLNQDPEILEAFEKAERAALKEAREAREHEEQRFQSD